MAPAKHREALNNGFQFNIGIGALSANLIRKTQEDFYLVLFMFASQLYFYVLGPISLLGY